MSTRSWLVDVLTKGLANARFQEIIIKLGMDDIYSPTWEEVLKLLQLVIAMYTTVCEDYYDCIHNCISFTTVYYSYNIYLGIFVNIIPNL